MEKKQTDLLTYHHVSQILAVIQDGASERLQIIINSYMLKYTNTIMNNSSYIKRSYINYFSDNALKLVQHFYLLRITMENVMTCRNTAHTIHLTKQWDTLINLSYRKIIWLKLNNLDRLEYSLNKVILNRSRLDPLLRSFCTIQSVMFSFIPLSYCL